MTKRKKIVAAIAVAFCTLSASVAFAASSGAVNSNTVSNTAVTGSSLDQAAIDALRSEVDPSVFLASGTLDDISESYAVSNLVSIDMLSQISIDQVMALSQALSNKANSQEGGLLGILQPVQPTTVDDQSPVSISIDFGDELSTGSSLRVVRGAVVYMPVPNKNLGSYKLVPVTTVSPFPGSVLKSAETLTAGLVKQASAQSGNVAVSIDTPVLSQIGVGVSRVTSSSSSQPNPVPEPFTMALPLAGMAILRTLRKRNK